MSKQTRKLVPKLRFPIFENSLEWSVVKLLKYIEEFRERSTVQDEYEVLTSSRGGLIRQRDYYDNSRIAERDNVGFNVIPPGYITYRSRSDDGLFFFNLNNLGVTGIVSIYYPVFRISSGENVFFAHLFSNYTEYIGRNSVGNAQKVLSLNELRQVTLPVPPIKEEQQKIADCLSSIDELVTAQTQKLDSFKAHKKGLMQQLFPAEGETVPKLRFSEFRDAEEWEIKPLDSLLTIGNGKDYKHLSKGDVPVYGSGGYMLSVDEHLYDGESVCIGRKGTINNPMFLSGKFWTVDTLFYTHSFKDCLPKFGYLIFQNINWLNHNEAGGVPSLSKTNVGKIEVAVPTLIEQEKIANSIFSIDELITAQTQKLDTLKTHKKGLMQQLFPSANEVIGE